jgi:hypothetical protein
MSEQKGFVVIQMLSVLQVKYCAYKTLIDQISGHPHPFVSKPADPTPSAPLLKAITMNVMVEV